MSSLPTVAHSVWVSISVCSHNIYISASEKEGGKEKSGMVSTGLSQFVTGWQKSSIIFELAPAGWCLPSRRPPLSDPTDDCCINLSHSDALDDLEDGCNDRRQKFSWLQCQKLDGKKLTRSANDENEQTQQPGTDRRLIFSGFLQFGGNEWTFRFEMCDIWHSHGAAAEGDNYRRFGHISSHRHVFFSLLVGQFHSLSGNHDDEEEEYSVFQKRNKTARNKLDSQSS